MTCRYQTCVNEALPNQSRCAEHRLRWLPGKSVEPQPWLPEWRKRLPARDETGRLAA